MLIQLSRRGSAAEPYHILERLKKEFDQFLGLGRTWRDLLSLWGIFEMSWAVFSNIRSRESPVGEFKGRFWDARAMSNVYM